MRRGMQPLLPAQSGFMRGMDDHGIRCGQNAAFHPPRFPRRVIKRRIACQRCLALEPEMGEVRRAIEQRGGWVVGFHCRQHSRRGLRTVQIDKVELARLRRKLGRRIEGASGSTPWRSRPMKPALSLPCSERGCSEARKLTSKPSRFSESTCEKIASDPHPGWAPESGHRSPALCGAPLAFPLAEKVLPALRDEPLRRGRPGPRQRKIAAMTASAAPCISTGTSCARAERQRSLIDQSPSSAASENALSPCSSAFGAMKISAEPHRVPQQAVF